MRKGQFEAMGLAMIVVLVSLGMFLMLFFTLNDKKGDFVGRFDSEQLGQNTIDALLKTNIADPACAASDVADIIEDVVVLQRNPCSRPSDEILKEIVETILAETLTNDDIPYAFTITADNTLILKSGACDVSQYQIDRPGEQTLTLFPSLTKVRIELSICAEVVR